MFSFLSDFFQKKAIDCFAPIPLERCRITKPYLLEREGIGEGTAILFAVPYFTPACDFPGRNLSAYAVGKNYHQFFERLFAELLPLLRQRFPQYRFAGFADHSPIAEVDAAVRAGLGIRGRNGLLLTEKYSSYVFLGSLITDAKLPCQPRELVDCENCGACLKKCPATDCGSCLSALTQKKGELSPTETTAILRYGSVWGCDICQEVCPHTAKAKKNGSIYSPIPFFAEDSLPHLTLAALDAMTDTEFEERAYAWRGRNTVRRNLILLENHQKEKEDTVC